MAAESRVKKSLLNARVNLIFYFLTLALSFFSRKIFLDTLWADFVGLTGTLQNILGFLNLAELGIGTAISFNLYKPLQENNKDKINDLISLFGYLYNRIGLIIMVIGIVISLFIPIIFSDTIFNISVIYFAFYSSLISTLIGYFINYRQIILSADQKTYIVAAYFQTGNIIKVIVQMTLAYYYNNYYIWILIELVFGIIYSFILNWKIKNEYPWLMTKIEDGPVLNKANPNILKSTKQVFVHKIKDFLLNQSDQIFIFAFVSLKMVAFYGNYVLITNRLIQLFTTTLDSVSAGVGNLVAEGNKNKILKVFWELTTIRYFIAGVIIFSLYYLMEPFIYLWLGEEYILKHEILILMLVNVFIMLTRGSIDIFNNAYGNYSDIWAAWTEGGINIIITIIAGYFYGISGILLGKIVSTFFLIVIWKPCYLFIKGFKISCLYYWKNIVKLYFVFFISFSILSFITQYIKIVPTESFINLAIYAFLVVFTYVVLNFLLMYLFIDGMKNFISRIPFLKNRKYG